MKPKKPPRTLEDFKRQAAERQKKYREAKKLNQGTERERIAKAKDATPPPAPAPKRDEILPDTPPPALPPPREQLDWTSTPSSRPTVFSTVRIDESFRGLSPESFVAVPKALPAPPDEPVQPVDGEDAPPAPEPTPMVDAAQTAGPTVEEREAAAQKFALAVALLTAAGAKAAREIVLASDLEEPWRSQLAGADPATVIAFVKGAAYRVGLKHEFIAKVAKIPYEDELVVGAAVLGSLGAIGLRRHQLAQLAESKPAPARPDVEEPERGDDDEPSDDNHRPAPAKTDDDWGEFAAPEVRS